PVDAGQFDHAFSAVGPHIPLPVVSDLVAGFRSEFFRDFLLPVMLPMGLFNVLGSLQNIESAAATGDTYATGPSLAVNGAGSMVASLFGSCFPTALYIGHPGWKAAGARSAYSALNGLFYGAVALSGLTYFIS